ncbi:phosphatase PAP2 family protein [soil metagenome]
MSGPTGFGSAPREYRSRSTRLRLILAAPAVALFTVITALICAAKADITFRDPDHVAALYVVEVGVGVAFLVWLDIFLRAKRRTSNRWPSRAEMGVVRRERWTAKRAGGVAVALVAFYVTYLAYRNLKSMIPLLRPGDLFDSQLADLDRAFFFGHDPATLLHGALGTGISAHVMSVFYVAFIVFLPLSLGLALVFAEKIEVSLLYAAALSINWVLGAASYFLLPALGPAYADPSLFTSLPHTEVTNLQQMLLDDRVAFLANTAVGTPQAIAAFASLHIAMSFTALLAAYALDLSRRVKWALWLWLAMIFLSTIYLGWHYVVDDIAGFAIGAAGLWLACLITGYDPRTRRSKEAPA